MIQLTVKQLQELFLDRTLYPEGSELKVQYVKNEKSSTLYKVDYQLVVGDTELIIGGFEDITKIDANKNICEDIIMPLLSRGHFLLHNYVAQQKANGTA